MATHDYNIANQTALNFRGDLNDALEAIVTTNSNATAPTTTYAHMFWYDTTNDLLKMRDESNSAWITLGYVDQSNLNFQPYIGGTQVTEVLDEDDMASDSDTGVPTQQSVKAYVDSLDTTVDGIDVKNRYYSKKNATYNTWATFTGLSGVKSFSALTYVEKTGSGDEELVMQTSTDGGSSWSSDFVLVDDDTGAPDNANLKTFIDFDSGDVFTHGSTNFTGFKSFSFASGIDAVRFQYGTTNDDKISVSLLVEEGWDS